MKFLFWCCPFFLLCFVHISRAASDERALSPPRGWNSRDAFSWKADEASFMTSVELVASRLKDHGYEYVVIDSLWYRERREGASITSGGYDLIDQWGRPVPDPPRWPSSGDGSGLSHIAKSVHDLGLKFGIHVMRGLSLVAYNANTPILDVTTGRAYQEGGRTWTAKDIGVKERTCPWMEQCFMSVNTDLGAGRAFLRSLYHQYNHWGVDFVKHDCVFGDDLDIKEIRTVSQILLKLNRPILYSISPGTNATPRMADEVAGLVNMYRITADASDTWNDVATHFDVARDFAAANKIAGSGLHGISWPDFDILPLGSITDRDSDEFNQRACRLTPDEQRTMVTLWAMAKSPLMFGGDMRMVDDDFTFNLITNPTVLEINSYSTKNREVEAFKGAMTASFSPCKWDANQMSELHNGTVVNAYSGLCSTGNVVKAADPSGIRIWFAAGPSLIDIYAAVFNLTPKEVSISGNIRAILKEVRGVMPTKASCKVREVWSDKDLGIITDQFHVRVPTHGTSLFVLNCD